jgi:hypothetical protein
MHQKEKIAAKGASVNWPLSSIVIALICPLQSYFRKLKRETTTSIKESWSTTMQCVRLFTFLLRCGPESAIFVPRKWRQQLKKVTGKRKQKRALHCG